MFDAVAAVGYNVDDNPEAKEVACVFVDHLIVIKSMVDRGEWLEREQLFKINQD